jgi:hypothetical protein
VSNIGGGGGGGERKGTEESVLDTSGGNYDSYGGEHTAAAAAAAAAAAVGGGVPTMESAVYYDEPVVELLERERREWHAERIKLLHCIHLQQIELNQRSIAAHEKAAEIAKEFVSAIDRFEERLVSMESNVQMLFKKDQVKQT